MTRFLILAGLTLGGWLGWWVGENVNLTAAFILSSIGSIGGVYLGWRISHDYFE